MSEIIYLLELAQRTEYPPELALASCLAEKKYNISVFATGRPEGDNYWTDWGGYYDNPIYPGVQLLFESYLTEVYSVAALLAVVGSFLVTQNFVYLNLYKKPWQFNDKVTETSSIELYSSAPRNRALPSDTTFEDALGNFINAPVKLDIPSVKSSLSDAINGTALYSTFSVSLNNEDGYFDNVQALNAYNTPVRLKRTSVLNPKLSDFNVIRYGFVDNVAVTQESLIVNCAEVLRSLTYPVTRRITTAIFPSAPAASIDKSIPIGYGVLYGIPLIPVGTNQYIALDPNYLTAVTTVYDKDGASISFTLLNGVITAIDAESADVTGLTNNTIGEIITSEIGSKSLIPYVENPWDKTETDYYISISPAIGLYFQDGDLRSLVVKCLQNDSAFLMTKNDGRLTLRRWGETYTTHTIESWPLMSVPTKTTENAVKLYFSSVLIEYNYNHTTQKYNNSYLDDTQELMLNELYRRKNRATFKTDLLNAVDAADLATRLLSRFGTISESISTALGIDTIAINLLDKIVMPIVINDRTFSPFTDWIVIDNDPGQDTVSIESI